MQPFSSTRAPLSDVTNNPCLNQPESTNPVGKLGNFDVVQSAVTSFFSSLSPNYIPEHQRQFRQPTADASTVPAENKNDKTSLADHVVQGVGLASKALSCWVPNVGAVSDAIGTICSSISLANTLDTMAMSGKSGKLAGESASRADNVPKIHSPKITNTKITNDNREDDQPDKSATTSGRANRVSGPAMATVTLMAMDQLAGAAAQASMPNSSNYSPSETLSSSKPLSSTIMLTSSSSSGQAQTNSALLGSSTTAITSSQFPESSVLPNINSSNAVMSSTLNTKYSMTTTPSSPSSMTSSGIAPTTSSTHTSSSPLASSALSSTLMPQTATTGNATTTPFSSTNAMTTAPSSMITTAPVTSGVVTPSQMPMTPASMAATTALPTTPLPLADTPNLAVVLAVSFGTAFTILAGIGLCACCQYYHRRGEAEITAEPGMPLEHLDQANP